MLKYLALLLFAASAVAQPFPARPGPVIISQPSTGGSSSTSGVDTNAVIALIEQYGGGGITSNTVVELVVDTWYTNGADAVIVEAQVELNNSSALMIFSVKDTNSAVAGYLPGSAAWNEFGNASKYAFATSTATEDNVQSLGGYVPAYAAFRYYASGTTAALYQNAPNGTRLVYFGAGSGGEGGGISSATATNIAAYQAYLATNGFTGGTSPAQVAAIMDTNNAAYQVQLQTPWIHKALRRGKNITIGLIGDSVMSSSGPLLADAGLIQMLQASYATNGGISAYGSSIAWHCSGAVGTTAYRTNFAGEHTGTAIPWQYWQLYPGGIIYGQNHQTLDGFVDTTAGGEITVSWIINTNAGNLLIDTRRAPSFSPVDSHKTVPMNVGTHGASAFTNVPVATRGQLRLTHSGGTEPAQLINIGFYRTNGPGITFGQYAQAGRTDWSGFPVTNWGRGLSGFQPTAVVIMEKNDRANFPSFLNFLSDLKTVWTNTDFVCVGSPADVNDSIAERETLNVWLKEWATTNDAYYFEPRLNSTNMINSLGYYDGPPHLSPEGNNFWFGQVFEAMGLLNANQTWNTNFTDYVAGNRVTGKTNIAAQYVGNGAGLTNLLWATNYVAADFAPTAGYIKFVGSNNALYAVSATKTNLISAP